MGKTERDTFSPVNLRPKRANLEKIATEMIFVPKVSTSVLVCQKKSLQESIGAFFFNRDFKF